MISLRHIIKSFRAPLAEPIKAVGHQERYRGQRRHPLGNLPQAGTFLDRHWSLLPPSGPRRTRGTPLLSAAAPAALAAAVATVIFVLVHDLKRDVQGEHPEAEEEGAQEPNVDHLQLSSFGEAI